MLKNKFTIFVLFIIFFSIGCARRGNISGGNKDTIAPILRYSLPKNYTTNFKGNEIKLYFNEYIQLKDVAKQLVISPPMTTAPDVLPNNPSKMIKIVIKDTLRPDTTYSLNFGQSLQDNNEGNSFPDFKYVFSTGSEIDSLKIEGTIKDALEQKTDNFVSIMLYEINEKYTDSVIYKQKPRYVTNTLDSLKTWKIENIKAGKYLLIALKDYNSNNKFDAKKDKIGFVKEQILIPTNKSYELKLFKEQLKTKFLKPSQASGNRAIIGFEGDVAGIVGTLKNKNEVLETVITKIPKNDSLQIWYKKIKTDSLQLSLTKDIYSKSSYFKIKDQKKDTLNLTPSQTGNLNFRDVFSLSSSTPIIKFDDSKISLRNKDSVVVPFSKTYDAFNQQIIFDFKKEEGQKYVFRFIPGAITDFYNKSVAHLHQENGPVGKGFFGFARMGLDYLIDNRNTLSISGNFVRGQFKNTDLININRDTTYPVQNAKSRPDRTLGAVSAPIRWQSRVSSGQGRQCSTRRRRGRPRPQTWVRRPS